jgi:uncharacterized protein with ParB-like and HNH nuclease domain
MASIESQDLSIGKLFSDFYIIPNYQREYVWEEDNVKQFFDDIYESFGDYESSVSEDYFIGSIIVCERAKNLYDVIDGQQRITTIFLFLSAIKHQFAKLDSNTYQGYINQINNSLSSIDTDDEGDLVERYRVELQYEDSCDVLQKIFKDKSSGQTKSTVSSKNLKAAYKKLQESIEDEFTDDASKLKKFYSYFLKSVTLVRVKTTDSHTALKVFETINGRGVQLDEMDLVKNLVFAKASREDHKEIQKFWKETIDTLHKHKIKPLEFIRYFIIAKYNEGKAFRKSSLSDWFFGKNETSFQKFYNDKPIDFAKELLNYSKTYVYFKEGKNSDGKRNRHLENINFLSSSLKMHLMLLLAGKHLSSELFFELSRQVENIIFIYFIVDESRPEQEKNFTQWCQEIRDINSPNDLSNFIDSKINYEKERLFDRFKQSLNKIEYKTRVRNSTIVKYILAKTSQYINEKAWGKLESIEEYNSKNIEIEHILPQKPSEEIKQSFDKPDEINKYINRLGNLTILEKPLNSSCSNKPFADKKSLYANSNYLLTRTLATKDGFGKNTAITKAIVNLETFSEWNSQSIDRRQEILVELAKEVWNI